MKKGDGSGAAKPAGKRLVAQNRKAFHHYFIEERLEAGLVLCGTEVKSLREGRASIAEAFAKPVDGELWLVGANIPEYSAKGYTTHDPTRPRKLLVSRRELARLNEALLRRGYTLVPLSLYFSPRGYAKVELGLGHGKKAYDKRHAAREESAKRDMARAMGRRRE